MKSHASKVFWFISTPRVFGTLPLNLIKNRSRDPGVNHYLLEIIHRCWMTSPENVLGDNKSNWDIFLSIFISKFPLVLDFTDFLLFILLTCVIDYVTTTDVFAATTFRYQWPSVYKALKYYCIIFQWIECAKHSIEKLRLYRFKSIVNNDLLLNSNN